MSIESLILDVKLIWIRFSEIFVRIRPSVGRVSNSIPPTSRKKLFLFWKVDLISPHLFHIPPIYSIFIEYLLLIFLYFPCFQNCWLDWSLQGLPVLQDMIHELFAWSTADVCRESLVVRTARKLWTEPGRF